MKCMEIARYIITKCFEDGMPITNFKLQYLLYFSQMESYNKRNTSLFDDDICARKFGPAITDVYREYSIYGGDEILESYRSDLRPEDIEIIDDVIDRYAKIDMWRLVEQVCNDNYADMIGKRIVWENERNKQ